MKIKRLDGQDGRRVLAGMIVNDVVCGRIAARWEGDGLFGGDAEDKIGGWCVDHYNKYRKAPGEQIQTIYERWLEKHEGDEYAESLKRVLKNINNDYIIEGDGYTADYVLGIADDLFDARQAQKLAEKIETYLENHQVRKALVEIKDFHRIDLSVSSVMKPSQDYSVWADTFSDDRERGLIEWPGDIGEFFGSSFQRGNLIAYMAPDKSRKSFMLMETAYRALRCRLRVAYFEVGDLMRTDVLERFGQRAAMRSKYAKSLNIPTGFNEDKSVKYRVRNAKVLTAAEAFKSFQKLCRGRDIFRLSCHSNSTISAAGVGNVVANWIRDGWKPDVVVIDYADILAAPKGFRETTDQIDETWKELRKISQEYDTLVVTATQSNAAAYSNQALLSRKHFSGRKTKLAHVNGMIGINIKDKDREQDTMRLNWIVRREKRYSDSNTVLVAGCLDCCCPVLVSKLSTKLGEEGSFDEDIP